MASVGQSLIEDLISPKLREENKPNFEESLLLSWYSPYREKKVPIPVKSSYLFIFWVFNFSPNGKLALHKNKNGWKVLLDLFWMCLFFLTALTVCLYVEWNANVKILLYFLNMMAAEILLDAYHHC